VIVVRPAVAPVMTPVDETVAIAVFSLAQVTVALGMTTPSALRTMAVIVDLPPMMRVALVGVMLICVGTVDDALAPPADVAPDGAVSGSPVMHPVAPKPSTTATAVAHAERAKSIWPTPSNVRSAAGLA
jgi:hypothetical protein